jgi:hypothetical protein
VECRKNAEFEIANGADFFVVGRLNLHGWRSSVAGRIEWLVGLGRRLLGAYRVAAPRLCAMPIRAKAIVHFHPSRRGNQQSAQNDQDKKSCQNIVPLKVVPDRGKIKNEFHKSSFDWFQYFLSQFNGQRSSAPRGPQQA